MKRPVFLRAFTWLYLSWCFLPVLVAIRASFTADRNSTGAPRGWTLRWYPFTLRDGELLHLFEHSLLLAVLTVVVAVPLGTGLALGIGRWRSRVTRPLAGVAFLAVGTPQLVLASLLFVLLASIWRIHLGTWSQAVGHATVAIPFVAIIVLARLRTLGRVYDEMAMDLGASPWQSVRIVLLPLLAPALAAGAAVAFVISYDNIVLSQWLCITSTCRTVPVSLFRRGEAGYPDPGTYALAVIAFGVTLLVVGILYVLWRLGRERTALSPRLPAGGLVAGR